MLTLVKEQGSILTKRNYENYPYFEDNEKYDYVMDNTMNQHIKFSKYHGAGNDFIMINAIKEQLLLSEELIYRMCDRRLGIGADGLILLMPSDNHDFKMKYYNCDGKEISAATEVVVLQLLHIIKISSKKQSLMKLSTEFTKQK